MKIQKAYGPGTTSPSPEPPEKFSPGSLVKAKKDGTVNPQSLNLISQRRLAEMANGARLSYQQVVAAAPVLNQLNDNNVSLYMETLRAPAPRDIRTGGPIALQHIANMRVM